MAFNHRGESFYSSYANHIQMVQLGVANQKFTKRAFNINKKGVK